MTDHYRDGTRVLVVADADPFTGWTGTVATTWIHDGELIHHVKFCDGNNAHYTFDELYHAPREKD